MTASYVNGNGVHLVVEAEPTHAEQTDMANADLVAAHRGDEFRYVPEWSDWIMWDGRRWALTGAKDHVLISIGEVMRTLETDVLALIAAIEADIEKGDRLGNDTSKLKARLKFQASRHKHFVTSQNTSRLGACERLLRARLTLPLSRLDADPWSFNCSNGTLDLRTAQLRPHTPSDYVTQLTNVAWSDTATCPTWDAFLYTAMGGNLSLVLYLKRLVGYALTGLTREHLLVFLYGNGSNGKSTFLATVKKLFGDYGCVAARDMLFEKRTAQHPTELAALYGKRFAMCSEIGEHAAVDEAKVKDLTGGDPVAVRRMNENFWTLEPTHTLFIGGNHKPVIRGDDNGIWRRMRLIPWLITVSGAARDSELPEKLLQELPGILRWAVNGCDEWRTGGLEEPAEVTSATSDYRNESDVLGQFLDGNCVFEPEAKMPAKLLRETYEAWCEELGHKPLGARKLGQRLRERNVTDSTMKASPGPGLMPRVVNSWKGVRLKSELEQSVGT